MNYYKSWHKFAKENYRDIMAIVYKYLSRHAGYNGPIDSTHIYDWTHHVLLDLKDYSVLTRYRKAKGKFTTYIYRCVVNAILRRVRNEKRAHKYPDPVPEAYTTAPYKKLLADEFRKFLKIYPPKYLTVYDAVQNGQTMAEVADSNNRSISWSYAQHWGLQYLFKCYCVGYTGAIADITFRSDTSPTTQT